MNVIDLRMEYKRETGDCMTPLTNEYFEHPPYIKWLEEKLLKHMELKKRLIPWESLDQKETIH